MSSSANLGVHRISTADLKRLLRALHRGVFTAPIGRAALIEKAFGDIEGHLRFIVGLDLAGAKAVICAVLEERAAWEKKLSRLEAELARATNG
jgi:hypothetical protein